MRNPDQSESKEIQVTCPECRHVFDHNVEIEVKLDIDIEIDAS